MGKGISFIITIVVIGFVNWIATLILDFSFLDASIIVGLICMIILYIPNASGGPMSSALNKSIQGDTGLKVEEKKNVYSPSLAFYASIVYFAGAVVATFIAYWDLFFG